MERYPDGIDSQRIFQKDVSGHFPDWIDRVKVAKLQGTLLLDEQRRNQAEGELAAELRAFLDRGDAEEADAAHTREALGLRGG